MKACLVLFQLKDIERRPFFVLLIIWIRVNRLWSHIKSQRSVELVYFLFMNIRMVYAIKGFRTLFPNTKTLKGTLLFEKSLGISSLVLRQKFLVTENLVVLLS